MSAPTNDTTWRIAYNESPHERYDTPLNRNVEAALTVVGAKVVGSSGGAGMGDPDDPTGADQEFLITADEVTARRARDHIRTALLNDREVTLEPATL